MARTQAIPKPPPGFILQEIGGTPPPPPGFITDDDDIPTQGLPARPQPAPNVPGGISRATPENALTPTSEAPAPALGAISDGALEGKGNVVRAPGPTMASNMLEAARRYGVTPQPGEAEEDLTRRIFAAHRQANTGEIPTPGPAQIFGLKEPPPAPAGFAGRIAGRRQTQNEAARGFVEKLELDRPLGLKPKARKEALQLFGLDRPNETFLGDILDAPARAAMTALETGSVVGDLLFRPVNATINAGIKATVQSGRNWGLTDAGADSLERELNKIIMLSGVMAGAAPPVTLAGRAGAAGRATARAKPEAPQVAHPSLKPVAERIQKAERKDRLLAEINRDLRAARIRLERLGDAPGTGKQSGQLKTRIAALEEEYADRRERIRNTEIMRPVTAAQRRKDRADARKLRQDIEGAQGARAAPAAAARAPEPPTGFVMDETPASRPAGTTEGWKPLVIQRNNIGREVLHLRRSASEARSTDEAAQIQARISGLTAEIDRLDQDIFADSTLPPGLRATLSTNRKEWGLPEIEDRPAAETPGPATTARDIERQRIAEEVSAIPPEVRADLEAGRLDELRNELRGLKKAPDHPEIRAHREDLRARIVAMQNAQAALNRQRLLDEPEQLNLFDERRLRAEARKAAARHAQGLPPQQRRQLMQQAEEAAVADAQTALLVQAQSKIGRRTAGEVTQASRIEWARRIGRRVETELFDALRPIKHLAERVAREKGEAPDYRPYREMRLTAGILGSLEAVHRRGTLKLNPDGSIGFRGRSLNEAFAPIADNLEDGLLYFVGRRASELHGRGIKTPWSQDEVIAMLDVGRRYPAAVRAFNAWQRFNEETLDFMEQAGVLNADTKARFREVGRSYVPFHKAGDVDPFEIRPEAGSLFERIKGGEGNIREVFENIVHHSNMMYDIALRNLAKREVYRFIERHELADVAQRVDAVNVGKLDAATKALVKKAEATMDEADAATAQALEGAVTPEMQQLLRNLGLTQDGPLTRVLSYNRPIADDIDFVYENGERKLYLLKDKSFAQAMHAHTPKAWELNNLLFAFGRTAANVLRRGATVEPGFILKNITRDAQVAYIQSGANFTPIIDTIRGLRNRMVQDENYWLMLANGGGWSSRFKGEISRSDDLADLYRIAGLDPARVLDSPEKIMGALKELNVWQAAKGAGRQALGALEETSSSFETANRLAEFRNVATQTGNLRDAAFASREITTDFALRGSNPGVRILASLIPFANARLQGLEKSVRAFRADPVRTARRTAFMVTLPSLALHALNREDDRYRQLPDYIKDHHWIIFAGNEEDAPYFLIPKGHEYGSFFGSIPERMFDAIVEKEGPRFAKAFGRLFTETITLGGYPQVMEPLQQLASNKSFSGAPIVSERLQKVRPEEQFDETTSATMREIGQALGISPKKAEYLVRGYLGTMGAHALMATDALTREITGEEAPSIPSERAPVLGRFFREQPVRNTQWERDIYDLAEESEMATATINKMIAEGREPDPTEREMKLRELHKALTGITKTAAAIRAQRRVIAFDKTMSRAEKDRQLKELDREKAALFKEAAGAIPPDIARRYGMTRPMQAPPPPPPGFVAQR